MLQDYEYDFCCSLHAKLKEKVKGKVYTTIKDDILYVEIHYKDLRFDMSFDNFSNGLLNSVSSDDYAMAVIKKYRKFIFDRYFYD